MVLENDDCDEILQLSAASLAALQEFYQEQQAVQEKFDKLKDSTADDARETVQIEDFTEDWQLSQFWYDQPTIDQLSRELLSVATDRQSQILCLSSPSVFVHMQSQMPAAQSNNIFLMEFDRRFNVYGPQFIPYDYNNPLGFESKYHDRFDVLLIDPPFLSEECFQKVYSTVTAVKRKNGGARILWCTGKIMRPLLEQCGLRETRFEPKHRGGRLSNDFGCFANYPAFAESQ